MTIVECIFVSDKVRDEKKNTNSVVMVAVALIVIVVLLVLAGATVGTLFGLGILGGNSAPTSSSTVTTTDVILPTVGGVLSSTPTPNVTLTIAVSPTVTSAPVVPTPTPTPVPTSRTGMYSLSQTVSGSYPNSGTISFATPFPNSASTIAAGGAALTRMTGYTCDGITFDTLTTASANVSVATCNGTTNPAVGVATGSVTNVTTGGQARHHLISVIGYTISGVTYPAVTNRNLNVYQIVTSSNAAGTSWLSGPTTLTQANTGFVTGCCAVTDPAGLPTVVTVSGGGVFSYAKMNSSGSLGLTYDLTAPSVSQFSPTRLLTLSGGGFIASTSTSSSGINLYITSTDNPASNAAWTQFYVAGYNTPSSVGRIGTRPCLAGKDGSNNLVFSFSTVNVPTADSSFGSPITVLSSAQGQVPSSAYNIQILPMVVNSVTVPCILWIDSSNNLRYIVANNAAGTSWPTFGTRVDTAGVSVFEAVSYPSGNIGVAYILITTTRARFAVLTSTTQTYAPLGTPTRLTTIGIGIVNGAPIAAVSDSSGNISVIPSTSNNEGFDDSVLIPYQADGF